jgi:hypothetical protein
MNCAPPCSIRSMLAVVITLAAGGAAVAQMEMRSLLSPRVVYEPLEIRYDTMAYFNADVDDQRSDLHMMRYDFSFMVPVWQSESQALRLGASVAAWDLDGDVRLPGTCDNLPGELWDVRLRGTYRQRLDNDWVWGIAASFGSASDRPFASTSEYAGEATLHLRIPAQDDDAWLLFLNYASNRSFLPNVPLPGFGYYWQPSEEFRTLVGLPVAWARWEPIERLTLEGRYLIPRSISARVGYRVVDAVQLYAGFDWDNERFLRSDRDDDDDRLFYYEKRVAGGVRWDITKAVWLDCSAGFAFDRFFFEGEDYGDRHDHRVDIADGPLLMLQVGARL